MPCFKPAWDKGFIMECNLRKWRIERMIPFNRNALWAKRVDLLLRTSIGHNVVSSTTPSNQANPASTPPHDAPPQDAPQAGAASPAGDAPDPTPEDDDLPPELGHITERV